jgi:hypothetical protein
VAPFGKHLVSIPPKLLAVGTLDGQVGRRQPGNVHDQLPAFAFPFGASAVQQRHVVEAGVTQNGRSSVNACPDRGAETTRPGR